MSLTKKIYKQHREELQAVQDAPARDKLRVSIEKRLENITKLILESTTSHERDMAIVDFHYGFMSVKKLLDKLDAITDEIPF